MKLHKKMNPTQLYIILITLFFNQFINAQGCNCSPEDYKNWNQGLAVNENGAIDYLESSNVIIKENIKLNKENLLAIKSRINKFHNGYYFDYNFYLNKKKSMPENFNVKLINNKGKSISINSTKKISSPNEYYNFIASKNTSFSSFITTGLITKIEFIDPQNSNTVLAYFYISMSESIEIEKLFCCAIKLKKDIVGQAN